MDLRQKILIVDDKHENLVAMRQVLRDVEAEIISATSGNEALAATLDHTFALAILDVMMPGMTGFELAEHLRSDASTRLLPIIFVTALQVDEQHHFTGYGAGGVDYIVKPFAPEILLAKVRIFLELDRQRQELQWQRDNLDRLVAERTRELECELIARKQAEEDRLALQAQLHQSQKLESIGRLAGGVAHDFNNKLMIILGNAELAMLDLESREKLLDHLQEIILAAEHSRDITGQLLAFSRQQLILPRVLNANEAIAASHKSLARLIGEHITCTFSPATDLWHTLIDPVQLDQIVMNLAVNALDAMPGGGTFSIASRNVTVDEFACTIRNDCSPGDYVQLTFSDTGTGIPEEHLPRIFEPFFTTKEVGKGTGLGLATIYGIVRQNHGCITVENSTSGGAIFTVYLPRHDVPDTETPESKETLVHGSGSILLVEDDAELCEMTANYLAKLGYAVHEAASPALALSIAADPGVAIDLVLADVVMPGMNGKELVDKIRQLRPEVKVIYVTGYTTETVSGEILASGIDLIQKPYDFVKMSVRLKQLLTTA